MINVQRLPYMNAVVSEGLRMYPPVPTGIPRRVGPGGGVFFGEFIPENVSYPLSPSSTLSRGDEAKRKEKRVC